MRVFHFFFAVKLFSTNSQRVQKKSKINYEILILFFRKCMILLLVVQRHILISVCAAFYRKKMLPMGGKKFSK